MPSPKSGGKTKKDTFFEFFVTVEFSHNYKFVATICDKKVTKFCSTKKYSKIKNIAVFLKLFSILGKATEHLQIVHSWSERSATDPTIIAEPL